MCSFQEHVCLKPLEQSFNQFTKSDWIRLDSCISSQTLCQSVNQSLNLSANTIICRQELLPGALKGLVSNLWPPPVFKVWSDTKHLIPPPANKLLKVVSLSEKLGAWKLLPNICPWVIRTVELGLRIHFAYHVCVMQHGLHYHETRAFVDTSCKFCWIKGP